MSKDFYKILGVEKTASQDDIKKAFRKLAHKYHPDKKEGDESKFKEVNEAYSVLSNEKKRSEYDSYGRVFSDGAGPGAGGFGGGDFSGFDFSQFTQGNKGGFEFDIGDIFGDFFTGSGGRKQKRGRDISIDIELTFEESIFGVERKILLNKLSVCDICSGTGAEKGSKTHSCKTCNGKGRVREVKQSFIGSFATEKVCDDCNGKGEVPEKRCKTCDGIGVTKRESEIKVKIPAGIERGEMVRLSGGGEAMPNGVAGDLYIKIHVKSHPLFTKDGVNLHMNLKIKLTDALLGAKYELNTLDGQITLKIPQGINQDEILRIKGKGVPIEGSSSRGDILVKIKIELPTKLSKKAKDAIEKLKEEGV